MLRIFIKLRRRRRRRRRLAAMFLHKWDKMRQEALEMHFVTIKRVSFGSDIEFGRHSFTVRFVSF